MTLLTRCFLRVLVGVQGRHAACRYIIGKQCCYCLILLFGLARITWMWLWPIDAIYTNRYRRYTKSNFLLVYYILVHVLLPVIWFSIPPPPPAPALAYWFVIVFDSDIFTCICIWFKIVQSIFIRICIWMNIFISLKNYFSCQPWCTMCVLRTIYMF